MTPEISSPLAIQRFEITHTPAQGVEMPGGAHIVNIRRMVDRTGSPLVRLAGCTAGQNNPDPIFIWAVVKPDAPKVKRVFYIYKTGEELSRPPKGQMLINVGGIETEDGTDLDHVFEIIDEPRGR